MSLWNLNPTLTYMIAMTDYVFHPAVLRNVIAYAAYQMAMDQGSGQLDFNAFLESDKALKTEYPILHQQSWCVINLFTDILTFAYWATVEKCNEA